MRCPLSALADAANASADGKLNILGEFDTLWTNGRPPVVHASMVFVAKLKVSAGELGPHRVHLRVVDEDMKLIRVVADGKMDFSQNPTPGVESAYQIIVPIQLAEFPDFGTFRFELLVDDVLMCDPEVHVRPAPGA